MEYLVGMVSMAKTVNVGTTEPKDKSVLLVPPVPEVFLEKTERTEHQVTSLDHQVH